ncbi:hypothetical protein CHARACLAT_020702 [Characodon lateralis]|uniref:Uncharacterized protein n=1 Tax=Characodon lateralis TaxID=208331 RepID=A0ABU7EKW5_9TELE|nr:hypothetical protein [Characodon lateralis]
MDRKGRGHPVISLVFVELSVHDVQKQLVFDRRGQLFIICCFYHLKISLLYLTHIGYLTGFWTSTWLLPPDPAFCLSL